jgi:hypothetical protein
MDVAEAVYGKKSKEHEKAWKQLIVDKHCLDSIAWRNPVKIDSDIYMFSPQYKIASTGRTFMIGGGLQGCSREMKNAAYTGIPDLHNYDLVASQVNGLRQQLKMAGLKTDWLDVYLSTRNNKSIYAERVGVSEKCWKDLIIQIIMGAHLSDHYYYGARDTIIKTLVKEVGDQFTAASLNDKLNRLKSAILPLIKEIDQWYRWLKEVYIPQHPTGVGGKYVKNACGKTLSLSELEEMPRYRVNPKLSAFFLQGLESAFIHYLTALGAKYGFLPIANEHDGLITIGTIPKVAVIEAGKLSGLESPELIEKTFLTTAPDKLPVPSYRSMTEPSTAIPAMY